MVSRGIMVSRVRWACRFQAANNFRLPSVVVAERSITQSIVRFPQNKTEHLFFRVTDRCWAKAGRAKLQTETIRGHIFLAPIELSIPCILSQRVPFSSPAFL